MRDALAILGAVLAIVALTMSVAVFRKNFSSGDDMASLMSRLSGAEGRAERLEKQFNDAAGRVASLSRNLADLEEKTAADPGKLAQTAVNKEVDSRISSAVQKEMNKRLKDAGAAAPARASDKTQQTYDNMVASLIRAVGAKPPLDKRVKAACERTRAGLNFLAVELSNKVISREEFNNRAADVRAGLDETLKNILGDEKFKRCENWKKNNKDAYTKRFLGL